MKMTQGAAALAGVLIPLTLLALGCEYGEESASGGDDVASAMLNGDRCSDKMCDCIDGCVLPDPGVTGVTGQAAAGQVDMAGNTRCWVTETATPGRTVGYDSLALAPNGPAHISYKPGSFGDTSLAVNLDGMLGISHGTACSVLGPCGVADRRTP